MRTPGRTLKTLLEAQAHSDVHRRVERVVLDEFAARLDHIAHQLGEQLVGLVGMLAPSPRSRERAFSSSVVSHSCSGFISPRPL